MRPSQIRPPQLPGRASTRPPPPGPASTRPWLRAVARPWRRAIAARRRLVAAALVATAVTLGLRVVTPGPGPTAPVTVAARDLPAGQLITQSDVVTVAWRAGTTPSGAIHSAVGLTLASPARRGEPITDARVRGPGLLAGQPAGSRAMAVRLTEPTSAMVHAGDRVDLVAGPSLPGEPSGEMAKADVIAEEVLVLAAPGGPDDGAGATDPVIGEGAFAGPVIGAGDGGDAAGGALLVVAVDVHTALRLAAVSGVRSLSVLMRRMG